MLPLWKKWDGISPDGEKRHEAIGVSTTAGPHARTCLHMGCDEPPTHGYVVKVRCYAHKLSGMTSFDDYSHTTMHEAGERVPVAPDERFL